MKMFNTKSILKVLAISFVLCLTGTITAFAATTAPTLGASAGYSVYSDAGLTNSGVGTHLWGKVGDNNVVHTGLTVGQVDSGTIDAGAGVAADAFTTAYNFLDSGSQTPITPLNLNGTHTVTPGVYTVGATALTGTLTLDGAGVYIFRSDSSISVSGAGTMNLINGATACNVFWEIPTSMTIDSAAHMEGTIIAQTGNITFVSGASLKGRALAHTQITLVNNVITEPVCTVASSGSGQVGQGTISVVKIVINDNGGTKKVEDFPLFINGNRVISGATSSFDAPANTYKVTETSDPHYVQTFSSNCANGEINLMPYDTRICVITNNDIGAPVVPPVPPLIDVVKVPSPLSLPKGSGSVLYTYTLHNIGTVPVTDITMIDDSCSPLKLISGDTNSDSKLETTETWTYTCSSTLSATHTNTVVATGWANGISATDIATATVVVGAEVPPLIHLTKIPSPLTLIEGGGMVTYTEKITNPGTVALNNVKLTDDKCSPMKYIDGDTNGDSKLDPTETWTYTCRAYLSETTTNTAVASGEANGFKVKDFAIATVVVAVAPVIPTLPNTGFGPANNATALPMALATSLFAISLLVYIMRKKDSV